MDTNQVRLLVREGVRLTGVNNDPRTTGRFYHNDAHAQMVHDGFVRIATPAFKAGKITQIQFWAGEVAGGWHDETQGKGGGINEEQSAQNSASYMSAWGISDEFIGLVREPILGTILSFQDGILHQQAEAMGNYLALLVADADLCSIGSSANIYLEMSRRLIMEMAGKTNLSSEEWKNGWAGQVKFQTGRKFLTIEANTLWGENLQNNLKTAIKLAK